MITAAALAQYATDIALLVVSFAVIFVGGKMGLSKAKQDLIDTMNAELKLVRTQLDDTRKDLSLAQASLAQYRAQVQTLLAFIQKSDVAGAAAVNAIARQMQDEDDIAIGRRRHS